MHKILGGINRMEKGRKCALDVIAALRQHWEGRFKVPKYHKIQQQFAIFYPI